MFQITITVDTEAGTRTSRNKYYNMTEA